MTDATEMTDRELLMVIYTRVEDMHDDLNGNGQPGLKERLDKVETRVEERTTKSTLIGAGSIGAMLTGLVTLSARVLGFV